MNYNQKSIIFISAIFLVAACASSEKASDDVQISIVKSEINAWLDLMPGPSPGKFHLSGNVIFKNSGTTDIDNINLTTITVFSEGQVIYTFTPYFNPKLQDENYMLKAGLEKEFVFGTDKGLKIIEKLGEIETIDIKFNFRSDEGNFNYDVKNISVERAY